MSPGFLYLKIPQSRAELLQSLGLEPTTEVSDLPEISDLPALNAYIKAAATEEEASIYELAGAVADLTRLVLAIESFFRSAIRAGEDDAAGSASEFVSIFINILGMEYIRRRSPVLHSTILLLEVIDSNAAANGGSVNLFRDTIIPYFRRLGQGLSTEESTQTLSDVLFITVAALL